MPGPWRSAAYWLPLHSLLSLLSYRTQNHQLRDGTTYNGLGLTPSITKENTLVLDPSSQVTLAVLT